MRRRKGAHLRSPEREGAITRRHAGQGTMVTCMRGPHSAVTALSTQRKTADRACLVRKADGAQMAKIEGFVKEENER